MILAHAKGRERERDSASAATATRRRRPVNEQSSPARMQSRLFRDIITFAAAFGLPAIVLCVSEFTLYTTTTTTTTICPSFCSSFSKTKGEKCVTVLISSSSPFALLQRRFLNGSFSAVSAGSATRLSSQKRRFFRNIMRKRVGRSSSSSNGGVLFLLFVAMMILVFF